LTVRLFPPLDNHDDWADFWRNDIGVNVIPADTEKKRTYENWKEWQDKPIPQETHNSWKSENAFSRGMAVILGDVYHRPDKDGQKFIFIDVDNQKAIEEIRRILGIVVRDKPYESLQFLAGDFLVEQHQDDLTRAHIYFYAKKTLRNKSSNKNNPTLCPKLTGNEIPSLEIKSEKGIAYCSPSYHINGHRYQIRGGEPISLDERQIDELEGQIAVLCRQYGVEYADSSACKPDDISGTHHEQSTLASKLWQANTIVFSGHNRHGAILSLIDSLLIKFPNESEEFLFQIAEMKNQRMCKDQNGNPAPLSETEMLSLFKQARAYAAKKLEERGKQENKNDSEERAEKTEDKEHDGRPRQFAQKFSSNDILVEAVLIRNKPYFLVSHQGSITIQATLALDDKILVPLDIDSYINKPYSFLSEEEVRLFIENANNENLDSLYRKTKSIWKKYVDADDFHISLCAADTVYTYYQDKIGLTHYLFFVGNVGSGKSNNLRVMQSLAYRNMTSTDITAANIYQFLGSMEEGQGTICEDEADDIDDDKDKMRIYKNGYTTGYPVLRTDTTYGRKQYRFHTFCFKAFAAERTPDSTKAKGFNQRIIQLTSLYGSPHYDISEVINPAGEEKYQGLLNELLETRNLLLIYRLLHFNDRISDIKLNIENREKQLFKPIIRIFQNTETLKTLLPIISKYVSQNRESNANTLYAFVYKTIKELIHLEHSAELESDKIWKRIKADLQGDEIPNRHQSYQSVEFGEISQKGIVQILKDVFGATKSKRHGQERKYVFDLSKIERLGKIYDLSIDIQVDQDDENGTHGTLVGLDAHLQGDEDGTHGMHGTLVEQDRHADRIGDQGRINNFGKNKEYDNKIISIDKQKLTEGHIADPKNVSQASRVSQKLVENGDASERNNNNVSQASHSESSNTIYRLGRSDIFACHNCRLRGDKWEMLKHPCKGAKK
jgi:hypothetical protein